MAASVWFFGTGRFAARCLRELAQSSEYGPSVVVTAPPSPAGRGMKLRPSATEEAAVELGLELHHSALVNRDEELKALFAEKKPDLILVIDFGQKVGDPWLEGPKCGCVNIHPSLLPQYRGAAPVQRSLINGERLAGVTLFRLVEKMDAGPIWLQASSAIGPDENAGELLERMAVLGCDLFKAHAAELLDGQAELTPQDDSKATLAAKIDKSETKLDPLVRTAQELHDLCRGLAPALSGYFMFRKKRVKVLQTRVGSCSGEAGTLFASKEGLCLACASGSLLLVQVQPEGKKPLAAADWLKGLRLDRPERIDA